MVEIVLVKMYQRTKFLTKEEADQNKQWILVDAEGQTLGRLATQIATILRGKNRPDWTPHVDCGDYVVVVNADKVRLTGQKGAQKKYFRHSGYPGHMKEVTAGKLLNTHPERVLTFAVRGMLPKTKLGRAMLKKLKVYSGGSHPHDAQKPEAISVNS